MPSHNDNGSGHGIWQEPEDHSPEKLDVSAGYEQTDIRATGIIVFVAAMGVFVVVTAVLCYGLGMVLNANMKKEDGPRSKWATTVDVSTLGNLVSSPELQNKMAAMTEQFPTPRLQLDDGNQAILDLHGREDLLLDHYTWVDPSQGKVRIPIERAMQLIAQRGLPVEPDAQHAPLMTGDANPVVTVPLTDGFARTGYEQDVAQAEKIAGQRAEQK